MSVSEDLHEWDYGEYEGLTTPQIRESRPDWNLWRDGCPGGESPEEVGARADRVLERVGEASGDALLFAHGHILRVICARWIEEPVAFGARVALSAGSLSDPGDPSSAMWPSSVKRASCGAGAWCRGRSCELHGSGVRWRGTVGRCVR